MTITYALLKDRSDAEQALGELEAIAENSNQMQISVVENGSHFDSLKLHETGALKGLANGVVFGSLGAALLLAALVIAGLVPANIFPTAFLAIGLGTFYGGLVGFIAGTSCPDANLSKLEALQEGESVIVTVASNNPSEIGEATHLLSQYGAVRSRPELF